MRHKSFADMRCPIARCLDAVGEWWSVLILRDAFAGKTRFDEFQASLGIAPNMLSRRLAALVDAGLLERRPYSTRPLRKGSPSASSVSYTTENLSPLRKAR